MNNRAGLEGWDVGSGPQDRQLLMAQARGYPGTGSRPCPPPDPDTTTGRRFVAAPENPHRQESPMRAVTYHGTETSVDPTMIR